jgi:hypothetical protein
MLSDFLASVFSALVLDPVQAEVRQTLERAGASIEVVQQSTECLSTAGPALVRQAVDDPWWATTTIVGMTFGYQQPSELLASGGPACQPIVQFLTTAEAQG